MERKVSLLGSFRRAQWHPAASVKRPFVRHLHPELSPGEFCFLPPLRPEAHVSVIIPTTDANRDGNFEKLLRQMDSQTLTDFEVIVVKGDPRQGRAINIGASLAKGAHLLTMDDDTALPDKYTFAKLAAVMEAYPGIGMVGGMNVIPPDAPPFVKRVMREIPRRSTPPVSEITDSDLAEHPLLMMRWDIFERVGGENELLPRGLDPYLRQEFRKAGFRVVIVPDVFYSHLPPDSLMKLLKQFFRNGKQASYVNRHFPQWVFETPNQHGHFRLQIPSSMRAIRLPYRLMKAFLTGKFVWFLCQLSYSAGFLKERITPDTI
jgi:GT2 family glycosyltransferase